MAVGQSRKQKGGFSKRRRKNNNKVHFASLMDICHLKDAELEPQFRKCKGRVVRGDIVKDVSGACAVSTEGSSVSQMMAAKVVDATARLPDCDGQAADANVSLHPGKTGGCSKVAQNVRSQNVQMFGYVFQRHKWPKSWDHIVDSTVLLERHFYGHPLAGLL